MIGELGDSKILSVVAGKMELLDMPLSVGDADRRLLRELLSSESLIYNMERTCIITMLAKLDAGMRGSLADLIDWDDKLLKRLATNPEHLRILHRMWDIAPDRTEFVRTYFRMLEQPEARSINVFDAFSQGQVDSKVWLADTVADLGLSLGLTWILCGWVGTLGYILLNSGDLGISKIRSFDIDEGCVPLADMLNKANLEDFWKFKAVPMDVNTLAYTKFPYHVTNSKNRTSKLRDTPDTIINTSCDHMIDKRWWDAIPAGRLVILQNNDWAENSQHHDTVNDLGEFMDRYPMDYVFTGELDCKIYRRFMLIGRK